MKPTAIHTRGRRVAAPARPPVSRFVPLLMTVGLLCAAGQALAVWPWSRGQTPQYPDVTTSVEWLVEHLGGRNLVVVDARARQSYRAGHIATAVSIPSDFVSEPRDAGVTLGQLGLTGRERIVCYGDSSYAGDAATLLWLLEVAGATSVSILDGGMGAWNRAGGDLETEERKLEATEWRRPPNPGALATVEYVAESYGRRDSTGRSNLEIIDARGWDAWEGSSSAADEESAGRVGHIPHSLPFDFRQFVSPDGTFVDPEETRAEFASLGPRPSNPVDLDAEFIVHGGGATGNGALGYFLLRRAGIATVRYYPGGWREWSSHRDLPVVRIIEAEELKARLDALRRWFRHDDTPPESFVLIDVRHEGDHGHAHIPGAVSLSSRIFADSLDVIIARHWPGIDRASDPIVTYCYGPLCIRSRYTSTAAARKGFLNVERFYGGLEAWRAVGGGLARAGE